MQLVYTALLMVPKRIQPQLEGLLIDETVYGIHWQTFMHNLTSSWHQSAASVSSVLIRCSVHAADGLY